MTDIDRNTLNEILAAYAEIRLKKKPSEWRIVYKGTIRTHQVQPKTEKSAQCPVPTRRSSGWPTYKKQSRKEGGSISSMLDKLKIFQIKKVV